VVVEREIYKARGVPRYFARFDDTDVKEDGCLIGITGDGDTPELAVEDYIPKISGKLLVLDAFGSGRREIQVPILDSSKIPNLKGL
jgi:hypothetical protein